MRVSAVVALVAAGIAACNAPYGAATADAVDGGTDGEARDADTSRDGASITEAGADADAGADANAETGANGMPFTLTTHAGTMLLGVAASATGVFFTEPGPPGKIWFRDLTPPHLETGVFGDEPGLGAIKVTGANEIQWAKGLNGTDGLSGVFKSAFTGLNRLSAIAVDVPNCRGFAYSPPNIHHCAIAGTGEIRRVEGGAITNNWVAGGGPNIFIDSYTVTGSSTFVVWTEATSIRTASAGVGASAPTTILAGILPVGVAVKSPWVYFTQQSGSIDRVRLDGTLHTTLFTPTTKPVSIGDITVAPDGRNVYWAQGEKIMGLSVTP